MFGITRRDLWAGYIGMSLQGLFLGLVAHSPNLFAISAILLGFDVFMWLKERDKSGN